MQNKVPAANLTLDDSYWLGNEIVHQLTTSASFILRVEVRPSEVELYFFTIYINSLIQCVCAMSSKILHPLKEIGERKKQHR
jgi:hypothetical protein